MARSTEELGALLNAELAPRLEQLRRVQESGIAEPERALVAPQLVVVLDGFAPDHPAASLPLFRELLTRARAARPASRRA